MVLLFGMIGVWYILQLKKQHQLKEQFSTQLINTQETERSRIAKELHDSIGQKLMLLSKTTKNLGNENAEQLLVNYELMDLITYCDDAIGADNIEDIGRVINEYRN